MHFGIQNILFLAMLAFGVGFFAMNIKRLIRNIGKGRAHDRHDQFSERLKTMLLVAIGQRKMVVKPVSGILHILVYVGFIIINIEMLEILIDGIFGTHRVLSFMGGLYDVLIGSFEILSLLVLVSVSAFFIRRNFMNIVRFKKPELKGWAGQDANWILIIETVIMTLFLLLNASDLALQQAALDAGFVSNLSDDARESLSHFINVGSYPVSQYLTAPFTHLIYGDPTSGVPLVLALERIFWWMHIAGILFFLNYLYYSKHLHILLAFPNVFFAKLQAKGQFSNDSNVTNEVKMMMDPNADPYAAAPEADPNAAPTVFGARDVFDLDQIQLLNAYTCTECGRCTEQCPANHTGKELSPRAIMMKTRDRLEEVSLILDKNKGEMVDDGKSLHDHISAEELWACSSCNACTQACPINIDPLSIIIDMRRYLVMEQSAAPQELNLMMGNIENNGAPWPFNVQDRLNWANEA